MQSVLRLALRQEPDSDRSPRGRHSKLPTWLLAKDFLVSSGRSGSDWLILWGMEIYIFILVKALVYVFHLHVNVESCFSVPSYNPYDLLWK